MKKAKLQGADLWATNLKNANLDSANLTGARFWEPGRYFVESPGANLEGARLYHTIIEHVVLRHSNLRNASLLGAYIKETDFVGSILPDGTIVKMGESVETERFTDASHPDFWSQNKG